MEPKIIRKVLLIEGMTCSNCALKIENRLKKMAGVLAVEASYGSSKVSVAYDVHVIRLNNIIEAIEKLDYIVNNKGEPIIAPKMAASNKLPFDQLIGIGMILLAAYIIIQKTVGFNFIPQVSQNMGYGLLFLVGLLTSLHCVAMCGGINLSQCVAYKSEKNHPGRLEQMKPSFLYNTGRVISYTLIGGMVGALGSVVSFSGAAKGLVAIIAGIFMIIMGLNLLGIFPQLRKLIPRMPKIFGRQVYKHSNKSPLFVGLLNGLMPCGPLQAMQLYALGTGSFEAGALSMLAFSLGTVPLMFGLGAVSSFLSRSFTAKMMKAGAVLVMVLGFVMLNRGLSLSGISLNNTVYASPAAAGAVAEIQGDVQRVTTQLEPGRYQAFIVQKGIPVQWTIQADEDDLNGCNRSVIIPEYGLSKDLTAGNNLIEFTPQDEGDFVYSCWMGMIRSSIQVVPDITQVSENDLNQADSQGQLPPGGGCCSPPAGNDLNQPNSTNLFSAGASCCSPAARNDLNQANNLNQPPAGGSCCGQ